MNTSEFELYDGKSYNDLLKDIVVNANNKRDQIDIVISELREKIQTINDAIVLAPIIQSYLDIAIKNDDALVKLASVVQKLISLKGSSNEDELGLTDLEKSQLLSDIKNIQIDVKTPVNIKKIEK